MKKRLLFAFISFILCINNEVSAQITLAFEDFEDATVTYSLMDESAGVPISEDISEILVEDYFGRVMLSDFDPADAINFTNIQGSSFFSAGDIDGIASYGVMNIGSLNWNSLDVSTSSFATISAFFAEDLDSGGNPWDWDANSQVEVQVSLDGGLYTSVLAWESTESGGPNNNQAAIDTDSDGIGDGALLTDVLTEYMSTVDVSAASTLDVRILITELDASSEDIAIDNVNIVGDNTLSVSDDELQSTISFINPVIDILSINSPRHTISTIELYSIIGTKVSESTSNELDMSLLSAGMYLAKVSFLENNRTTVVRVLKK